MQKSPKSANYYALMFSFFTLLFLGNGADKITTRGNIASRYESLRNANRYYIPYSIANYSYNFPNVKQ